MRTEALLQALHNAEDTPRTLPPTSASSQRREWREQLLIKLPGSASRAASNAMLSPPLTLSSKPQPPGFQQHGRPGLRGYDKRRNSAGLEASALAQKHLEEDLSPGEIWSPLSGKSTTASLAGESDLSTSPTCRSSCGDDSNVQSARDAGTGSRRLLTRLLRRRSSGPVLYQSDGLADDFEPQLERRHSAPVNAAEKPQRAIRQLRADEKIYDLYHWDEVLQEEGDGGKVVVCKLKALHRKSDAEAFVMKIRAKEQLRETHFEEQFRKSQLRMLNFPPHPGVLALREVLEDDKFYYIVMDKANGGNFFSSLLSEFQDGVMPAAAVQQLLREILEAVSHVHKQGMLHRDIKPDNLVMQLCDNGEGRCGTVKKVALIDFDHADPDWNPMTTMRRQNEFCGTVQFSAPEAFMGYFSQSSDLYSVGVILYLLMTGKMPYADEIYDEEIKRRDSARKQHCLWSNTTVERMKACPIDWDCNPWPEQKQCRSFCRSLLAFDPLMRPASADEALNHAWFSSS